MEKKKVFVIMPFQEVFFEVYEMLKEEFIDEFEFSNANDEGNPQNILRDVIQPIYESEIVLADLTGLNPNVMYELGLAHSFNKKTIIITQDDLNDLPFDLKQYRAKNYSTHFKKFAELIAYLKRVLQGALDDSVTFGNPVADFLMSEHITDVDWFKEKKGAMLEETGEAGFLDFLADMETDITEFGKRIQEMDSDMTTMNDGLERSNNEIDRVTKIGGSGTATFIRKEAKKVSKVIDTFSGKFKKNNNELFELWDKIEKNALGLIESPYVSMDENKQALADYIISLKELRKSAKESSTAMQGLQESVNGVIGLERTLSQSAKYLISDLGTYIDFIECLDKSVEKIVNKSRYVIGDIE